QPRFAKTRNAARPGDRRPGHLVVRGRARQGLCAASASVRGIVLSTSGARRLARHGWKAESLARTPTGVGGAAGAALACRAQGEAVSGFDVWVEGVDVVAVASAENPMHDIGPESASGKEASLAHALGDVGRRRAEATGPDLAGTFV